VRIRGLPNAHAVCFPYGTVNAAICERFIPGYKSPNACDAIAASPFPDSDNEVERAQHPMQAKLALLTFPEMPPSHLTTCAGTVGYFSM
jgi:hypothetical protein